MLENYSWKSARQTFQDRKVALIPVGSTEQHGPHLPLGTDFLEAQTLAELVARKTGVICTPVIPIGVSSHHRQFWGTLWVSPQSFRQYMYDIATSLAFHGVRRIIFVNGHGGNVPSLQEISHTLRLERVHALVFHWWTDPRAVELQNRLFKSKGRHADGLETSVILAIRPELVDMKSIDEAVKGAPPQYGITKFGAQLPIDTIDISQSGATLDPREATVEAGKQLFQLAEQILLDLVNWFEKATDAELETKPHKD